MPRDNTNDPTDCAVICPAHGRQFVTVRERAPCDHTQP